MLTSSELSALAAEMNREDGLTPEDADRFYDALATASKCKGEGCAVRVGADWYYVDTHKNGRVWSGRPIDLVNTDDNTAETFADLWAKWEHLSPTEGLTDLLLLPSEGDTGRMLQFCRTQATGYTVRIVRLP